MSRRLRVPAPPILLAGAVVGAGVVLAQGASAHAAEDDAAFQMTATMNVRSGPSTSYEVTGRLARGEIVRGEMLSNGWIKFDEGYVWGSHSLPVTAAGESTYRVESALNIRSGPSINHQRIGAYPQGTVITGVLQDNGWVETDDGYVSGYYLTHLEGELPDEPDPDEPDPDEPDPDEPDPDEPDPVVQGDTYRIDSRVNIRSGPGTEHDVIGQFPAGQRVVGVQEYGWVRTDQGYFWHTFATVVESDVEPEPEPETPDGQVTRHIQLPEDDYFTNVYLTTQRYSEVVGYLPNGGVVKGEYTVDGAYLKIGPYHYVRADDLTEAAGAYDGSNGRLDPSSLCSNQVPGTEFMLLDCNGARDLNRLSNAYESEFGRPLQFNECYRTYETQVYYKERSGFWAAEPGTSNHGWARACDLKKMASHDFGSAHYRWMVENAPEFGWEHPSWAREGAYKPEYWHWEYVR